MVSLVNVHYPLPVCIVPMRHAQRYVLLIVFIQQTMASCYMTRIYVLAGYCFYACPFGAPQFPEAAAFSSRGKMDKCTFCAGGPEEDHSSDEYKKYGRNRIAEGKLPLCAEMCSTKALLAGDANILSDIYRKRVINRGASVLNWGVSYDNTNLKS